MVHRTVIVPIMASVSRLCLLAVLCFYAFPGSARDYTQPIQITVLAEESLTIPLVLIVREYTASNSVSINLSFDSTAHQVGKIEEGEPADVFITASEYALKRLKLQGMLDAYTHIPVAGNSLILAVAASNPLTFDMETEKTEKAETETGEGEEIKKANRENLLRRLPQYPVPLFVLTDENLYAEGIFATELLKNLGLYSGDDDMMLPLPFSRPQPANIVMLPRRREVVELVAQGGGYGIIYATEVRRYTGIRQATLLPESLHKPVKYIAVVVAGKEMTAAREFVQYLRSATARDIFAHNGFTVP